MLPIARMALSSPMRHRAFLVALALVAAALVPAGAAPDAAGGGFGNGGWYVLPVEGAVAGIVPQRDGKVLVVLDTGGQAYVVRLLPDGRFATDLPPGQPSCGLTPSAIGAPSVPARSLMPLSRATGRTRSDTLTNQLSD